MRNYMSYLALVLLIILASGCKDEVVTVHLTVRNKTSVRVDGGKLEFNGRQRGFGVLIPDGLQWNFAVTLPRHMDVITVHWTENEEERSAEIRALPIPTKRKEIPEVVFTYRETGWEMSVGYEKPADW